MKLQTPTKLMVLILFQCFVITVLSAQTPTPTQTDSGVAKFPEAGAYASTKLTYKIIDAPNHSFGYDVYANGKLLIHQASIPAMPGNEGFKTKADAEKVAQLVMGKIRKGEMPPTVMVEEMKKLKVIK
jgi:hypothetical protein